MASSRSFKGLAASLERNSRICSESMLMIIGLGVLPEEIRSFPVGIRLLRYARNNILFNAFVLEISEKLLLQGWEPFRVNPFRMNPAYGSVGH